MMNQIFLYFSKLYLLCSRSPCLFWIVLALGFFLFDFILAHCAVLHCEDKPADSTTVLVASDPHFNEVCPFSSIWMRHLMAAAVYNWKPDAIVVTGDILNNVGGESSALNVSNWWYETLAFQVKDSMRCESAKCYFAPGNHDLELAKYHHRYVKHFGWPHSYQKAGNTFFYLFNSMDPNGTLAVPNGEGPVDFLFAHYPVKSEYIKFQPSNQFFQTVKPKWIVNGHDHVARKQHTVNFRDWNMNEITVPSLSFYRSRRDGGKTGFVLLYKSRNGDITTQLCEPWERSILITVRAILLAILVYSYCQKSRVSIARRLFLWLLWLLGIAYILLAFFGWVTLIWTCAFACFFLLLYHGNSLEPNYLLIEIQETSLPTRPVITNNTFQV